MVDDSEVNLAVLKKILSQDYSLLTATNGRMAMDILESTSASVAAVVLDLVMPVMDGYEVLRRIRADERLASLPVIIATGGMDDEKELLALRLGANDYVTKPYKPEIIRNRIANTIFMHETAAFINTVKHDSLTGLYSRDFFENNAEKILKSDPSRRYDLICCDIERFKLVNDLYGKETGNRLLKYCADIFADVFAMQGICGRLESDIFAFLVPHSDEYESAFFESINKRVNGFDINLVLQLRFGIYSPASVSVPIGIMCDRARLAIASIKGLYDIYYKYYDDTIRNRLVNEQFIAANMKKALENGEFEVYYQPKYDLRTERISSAEALVRWNSPEKGLMSPLDFIPLFERNGFIVDLDAYVWENCCKCIRSWIDRGLRAIPLSVNVSRADLFNPHLTQMLQGLLKKYSLDTRLISLEITESAYTQNSEQLVQTVKKLRDIGFSIEMDDFGTGYSSLNMLSELPINVLKLDTSFMHNHHKEGRRNILSFVISLAKWLGLVVGAEGVESEEQVSLLRSLNCDIAQGYYFAKPMPRDEFEELLLRQVGPSPMLVADKEQASGDVGAYRSRAILVYGCLLGDRQTLESALGERYTLTFRSSSEEIIRYVDNCRDEVCAVLCGIYTAPDLDALTMLSVHCETHNIPVISLHESDEFLQKAVDMRVADYIQRPYLGAMLRQRINRVADLYYADRQAALDSNERTICAMKHRAQDDMLTGLLNRAECKLRVEELIKRDKQPQGTFVLLDVNAFRKLNQASGHAYGDGVLKAIAMSLQALFTQNEIIGRIGGDEFVLYMPYIPNDNWLDEKLLLLCAGDVEPVRGRGVTCSAGICFVPLHGEDFDRLYTNAMTALMHSKAESASGYYVYREGMDIPLDSLLEGKAASLLDNASEALFISDAVTSEILYINNMACRLIEKRRADCTGARCYELFWDRCMKCDRCFAIDMNDGFYEEDTYMKDGKTRIHLRAHIETWDARRVKIHYISRAAVN